VPNSDSLSEVSQPNWEHTSVKNDRQRELLRRDLLRLTIGGAGLITSGQLLPGPATAKPVDMEDKRRARYRADSPEVQEFYRVNSYPGGR
jgi:hypothetical protein